MTNNLSQLGFDFLDGFEANTTLRDIGERLGGLLNVPNLPIVQTLTPKAKASQSSNTYSGLFGHGEFPLHTDMAHWHVPPRYVVMRCVTPNDHVRTTLLRASLVMPEHRASVAKRALFRPRRRLDGVAYFLRLSEPYLFRWDSVFIEPANGIARQLRSDILNRLTEAPVESISFTKRGQVLIIDNWSLLHGRSSINDASQERAIERIYLRSVAL